MNRLIRATVALCLAILAASALSSCDKEENSFSYNNSDVVSISHALDNLNNTYTTLFPETKSHSIIEDIESIDIIGSSLLEKTKGAGSIPIPDTLVYLVNFCNETGFAVLSANKILNEDVYAIADSGSLSVEDFREAFEFMHSAPTQYTDSTLTDIGELTVPSILLSGIFSCLYDHHEQTHAETNTKASFSIKYGPFLKTKWDQREPFNNLTKKDCPAGCVAIATAQILVANKKSNTMTFNDKVCTWSDLESIYNYQSPGYAGTDEAQLQAANFMKVIGDSKHCKIRYNTNGSYGYAEGAQRTFQALGYKDVDKHLGFGDKNQKIAKRIISHGKPVYLGGCKKGSSDGHAWVLDGYAKDSNGKEYYHINWGWRGKRDGYYSCGTFNTEKGQFPDDETDKNTSISSGPANNYTWTYRMVTYSL